VASELTGLSTLGQLARDSLEARRYIVSGYQNTDFTTQYSTLEKDEKKQAIAIWENRWSKFIDELLTSVT
jgi:hypothetical protein